jgi:hypothetical protein
MSQSSDDVGGVIDITDCNGNIPASCTTEGYDGWKVPDEGACFRVIAKDKNGNSLPNGSSISVLSGFFAEHFAVRDNTVNENEEYIFIPNTGIEGMESIDFVVRSPRIIASRTDTLCQD